MCICADLFGLLAGKPDHSVKLVFVNLDDLRRGTASPAELKIWVWYIQVEKRHRLARLRVHW
jgi:hypothetical protein